MVRWLWQQHGQNNEQVKSLVTSFDKDFGETFMKCSVLLKDVRSSADGRELIIDRQQDCISIARSNKDEIAFRRQFDTCDEDDFPFHEGTMFIYWMRGEEPLEFDDNFPTPDMEESDFGMTPLQLLRADSIKIPEKWVKTKNFIQTFTFLQFTAIAVAAFGIGSLRSPPSASSRHRFSKKLWKRFDDKM